MQDAETRALRRAVVLLVAISAARWLWTHAGPIGAPDEPSILPRLTEEVTEAAAEASARGRPLRPGERIDPNLADEAELDRLPGVGPATAAAIVRLREGGASFRRPDDLLRVRGIGPALVARMEPYLSLAGAPVGPTRSTRSVGPAEAVDINRAGPEALTALPGIGPALAARIVEHRRNGPFRTLEELTAVRGIGPATVERLRGRARVGRVP